MRIKSKLDTECDWPMSQIWVKSVRLDLLCNQWRGLSLALVEDLNEYRHMIRL